MQSTSQEPRPRRPLPLRVLSRLRYLVSRARPRRVLATMRWAARAVRTTLELRRERRLTVAVDISALFEPLTGIGWYLYRLLDQLATRDDVALRLYGPQLAPLTDGTGPEVVAPVVELPIGPALHFVRYEVPEDLSLPPWRLAQLLRRLAPLLLAAHGNRVVFAPNYLPPRRFAFCRGALVATVHDLGFRQVPWTLQEETLQDLENRLERTLARAQHLITPSRSVRDEMLAAGMAEESRIHAVLHGPGQLSERGDAPATPPTGTPAEYCLHVGTIEPRKNLQVVLAAWRELRRRGLEPPMLILCGRLGWKSEGLRSELEAAGAEGWLQHHGYLPGEQLAALYQGARAVVFPSLYEGFGLPAVEAQHAGAPLVASDIPVLREVAGDGALFAPPEDAEAWADQLERLLAHDEAGKDLRRRLIERGRANAARLSWKRAAEETLAVWSRAAEKG